MKWPSTKNMEDVMSLMGVEGNQKSFIVILSITSYPITSLHRKGRKFEWTKECATRFEKLKTFLKNAPTFKIVDPHNKFIVYTYACKKGLCEFLMQEG